MFFEGHGVGEKNKITTTEYTEEKTNKILNLFLCEA